MGRRGAEDGVEEDLERVVVDAVLGPDEYARLGRLREAHLGEFCSEVRRKVGVCGLRGRRGGRRGGCRGGG